MPRARPKTIVANSLEELELLNRLHANASGEPSPNTNPPVDPDLPHPDVEEPDEDDERDDDDDDEAPDDEDDKTPRTPRTPRTPAGHMLQILQYWVYPGNLQGRPDYVDPSWAAYAFYDEATRLPSSPALRIPTPQGDKLARPGDYVVLQTADRGITTTVDVWSKTDFERLFPKPPAHSVAA